MGITIKASLVVILLLIHVRAFSWQTRSEPLAIGARFKEKATVSKNSEDRIGALTVISRNERGRANGIFLLNIKRSSLPCVLFVFRESLGSEVLEAF